MSMHWETVEIPSFTVLPGSIVPRNQVLQPLQQFVPHRHNWHQLVYARQGALQVTVGQRWYLINSGQAIWIPRQHEHTTAALVPTAFCSLYLEDNPAWALPAALQLLTVTPLMRELVIELDQAYSQSAAVAADPYLPTLNALIAAQIGRLPVFDFYLPWPQSSGLQSVCRQLYQAPAQPQALDDWAQQLGLSSRTLSRHFRQELGISLRQWQYLLRSYLAMEWLSLGKNITAIALDLGYQTPAAFSYMFRQQTGLSPSAWRARQCTPPSRQNADFMSQNK